MYSIVLWYLLHNNIDISKYKIINKASGYTMTESADFNHVINGKIPLKQWRKEFKGSLAHALIFKNDIIPAIVPMVSTIKKWLKER